MLLPPPVLLVHPPNSSSAVTLGAVVRPPDAPGTTLWLANELPELLPQSKLLAVVVLVASGLFTGAALVVSGVLHALPPQTSEPPQAAEDCPREAIGFAGWATGDAAGGDLAWLAERLKTEVAAADGGGLLDIVGAGAAADCAGEEKSNRSPRAAEAGAGAAAGLGGAADRVGDENAL